VCGMRQLNKRIDDLAKEQDAMLAAQAEQMRQAQMRLDAEREQKARYDAYRAEFEKIAADDHRRQEREREAKLEAQAKEGPNRDAGARYAQAVDLRKRIEGAEYIVLTSDRIAQQSMVITGRRDSEEAVKFRRRASAYLIEAQNLRQQLRRLERGPDQEKEVGRERSAPKARRAKHRSSGEYAPINTKPRDTQQRKDRDRDR